MEETIIDAITNKRLLKFSYHEYDRIVEPHVYGVKDGKEALLVFQVSGESSSGGLPEWRRMFLDEITNLEILEEKFPGQRPTPSGKHSSFDKTIKIVD